MTDMLQEMTRQLEGARDQLAQDLADEKAWAEANKKTMDAAAFNDHADAVAAIAKLVFPRVGSGVDAVTTRLAHGTQRLLAEQATRGVANR
ncbi:MAG TPA: hypothetical protein VGX27_14160 [Candidatus Dormibacteraeota bacterium]|nr:hypothetical protein [Candidatus Dormibacteraeota bacterium]